MTRIRWATMTRIRWVKYFFWLWFIAGISNSILTQNPVYLKDIALLALVISFLWWCICDFSTFFVRDYVPSVDYRDLTARIWKLENKNWKVKK